MSLLLIGCYVEWQIPSDGFTIVESNFLASVPCNWINQDLKHQLDPHLCVCRQRSGDNVENSVQLLFMSESTTFDSIWKQLLSFVWYVYQWHTATIHYLLQILSQMLITPVRGGGMWILTTSHTFITFPVSRWWHYLTCVHIRFFGAIIVSVNATKQKFDKDKQLQRFCFVFSLIPAKCVQGSSTTVVR